MLERSGLTHVDVLSLDVEGHEMMVLSGLNFSRITIETILLEPPCELKPRICALLRHADYQLVGTTSAAR